MNFQQLEYIVAVDSQRHFARAAEKCCVTQATLSMMIKKLEEELGTVIFDRSKQPVVPTETGRSVIEQARNVLRESRAMTEIVRHAKSEISGELRIGIIPTLAPYLLPLFLPGFLKKNPALRLKISEINTPEIIKMLGREQLDVGILATPLGVDGLQEMPLFCERFKVFVSGNEPASAKSFLLPEDLDVNRLWLLQEGHCLRSQALNLCELQQKQASAHHLDYEAGSIESLLKIVEMNDGITILPELATIGFDEQKKRQLRHFQPPSPVRQISLVTYRHFVKQRLLEALREEITAAVLPVLPKEEDGRRIVEI